MKNAWTDVISAIFGWKGGGAASIRGVPGTIIGAIGTKAAAV